MKSGVDRDLRISFVYPMFNEIGNIGTVIRSTCEIGASVLKEFEVIVVDDCSTDGSGEAADRLAEEFPHVRVIHHGRNTKLGGALKTGFAAARMDYILYMDSDMPVSFHDVGKCLKNLTGPPDALVGYRIGRAEGIYRDVQSRGYNLLLALLFGLRVRDANFAFKLFRRTAVPLSLHSEGSFIDAELLLEMMRRGIRIEETGFQYHARTAGESTIGGPSVVPQLLRDMMHYRRTRWKRPLHAAKAVVFNADDFGLCASINAGVIESHRGGVVRSASLIATGGAFEEAADYARENPSLDPGLHLALCEGRPVCDPARVPSLVSHTGCLHENHAAFLRRYFCGKISLGEVEKEFRAQLDKAVGAGISISHLDSHQHLHMLPAIFKIVLRLAKEHRIPVVRFSDERAGTWIPERGRTFRALQRIGLSQICRLSQRDLARSGIAVPEHFSGILDAGRWNLEKLRAKIRSLGPGLTEICCHPRLRQPGEREFNCNYNDREELSALTGGGLSQFIEEENVSVTSFRDYFSEARRPSAAKT
jgi:hopanoid biosynthesis associated protein HpnK